MTTDYVGRLEMGVLKFVYILVVLIVFSCLFTSFLDNLHWSPLTDLQSSYASFSIFVKRRLKQASLSSPEQIDSVSKPKYLSYDTRGGWNNQRIILENAILFSKLLNRTLIAHPLKPHRQSKSVHHNIKISKVIDLTKLRNLIDVIEETGSQSEFKARYRNLTWKTICRNRKIVFWVGKLLPKSHAEALKILLNEGTAFNISLTRSWNICKDNLAKKQSKFEMWGILDDLLNSEEEMIYFSSGSLFFGKLYFTSKSTALTARTWIRDYFTYSDEITRTATTIANSIGTRFNAVHVRRADYITKEPFGPDHWLSLLEEQHALNISNILYVATDERNRAWFKSFRQNGYSLLFSDSFTSAINVSGLHDTLIKDYVALHEQLICTKAKVFVGSDYSTFSWLIKRLRGNKSSLEDSLGSSLYSAKWIGAIKSFKLPRKLKKKHRSKLKKKYRSKRKKKFPGGITKLG